jgi:serine/threonine protein kinase
MLLQECAPQGDLGELLRQQTSLPNEQVLCEMFTQISDAMHFLSGKHIIHGDLACRNILVFTYDQTNPKRNILKLTDFGLTRASALYQTVAANNTATLESVPYRAAAPEVLQHNHRESFTEKSDVFSMGVLMWEALSKGKAPWAQFEYQQVCTKVLNGERLSQPSACSNRLWSIIIKCMAQRPKDRPTFFQLNASIKALYSQSNGLYTINIQYNFK